MRRWFGRNDLVTFSRRSADTFAWIATAAITVSFRRAAAFIAYLSRCRLTGRRRRRLRPRGWRRWRRDQAASDSTVARRSISARNDCSAAALQQIAFKGGPASSWLTWPWAMAAEA